jgi:DUF1365 family protein
MRPNPMGTPSDPLPSLPALVDGWVAHRRKGPVRHAFRHRAYQWLVDLDHVPQPRRPLKAFASFRAADHLGDPRRPIKENVLRFIASQGVDLGSAARIVMLANARMLGHVFDPLSVFWCYDGQGALHCVVAEVHNTYGERHAYLLRPDPSGKAVTSKDFYVSPFYEVSGQYELSFVLQQARVGVTVRLRHDGVVAFTASFSGRPAPVTNRRLVGQLLRQPLMTYRVSALIRLHGVWLWARGLRVKSRPVHPPQPGVTA